MTDDMTAWDNFYQRLCLACESSLELETLVQVRHKIKAEWLDQKADEKARKEAR